MSDTGLQMRLEQAPPSDQEPSVHIHASLARRHNWWPLLDAAPFPKVLAVRCFAVRRTAPANEVVGNSDDESPSCPRIEWLYMAGIRNTDGLSGKQKVGSATAKEKDE
ncbi:hypothetical protein [Mesorhizobium sp. dw_380]|uniref:hypothetical protein n=1 Tax=Mesorhizobium sp. dw_380 TaxID=2812001 RepID=UPI001BDF64EA|nr:hypothetical protein [Mesorhizobium sp. dw_380]